MAEELLQETQQQYPPSKAAKLYQKLLQDGYQKDYLGDEATFVKNTSDSTKSAKLYQKLLEDGYQKDYLGEQDAFVSQLVPVKKKVGSINFDKSSLQAGTDLSQSQSHSPLPSEESSIVEDPINLSKQAKELSEKGDFVVGGGTGGAAGSFVPDQEAIKQSKELKTKIKTKYGIDADELANDFSDFPEEAFKLPTTSKETLLNLHNTNPIEYKMRLNSAKNVFSIANGFAKNAFDELPESDPNREYRAKQMGIHTANIYNKLNESDGTFEGFVNNKQQQIDIINKSLSGDDKTKALDRLKTNSSILINAADPSVMKSYDESDLKTLVDPNQYAGLMTYKLFEPDKYEQAINILKAKISPLYNIHLSTDDMKNFQSPVAASPTIQTGDSAVAAKNKGTLAQETIDQQIGQETIKRQLAKFGRENLYQQLTREQYKLENEFKNTQDPNQKNQLVQQYNNNQNTINNVLLESKADDIKYPLTAKLKFDQQVKEITQDEEQGVFGYGLNRFMKSLYGTGAGIDDMAIGLFGGKEANTKLQMQRLGETKGFENMMYLPENFRRTGSPEILQASENLKNKVKEITGGKSMSNWTSEERTKVNDVVAKNQDEIKTITNSEAGKSKNFLTKATGYEVAGFTGDVASFMMQVGALKGIGLGAKVAEAGQLFSNAYAENYNKATEEGMSSSQAHKYGMLHGGVMALAGLVNSKFENVQKILGGGKSALSKEIAGLGEAGWKAILEKSPSITNKVLNSAKSVIGENAKNIATFGVGTSIVNDLVDNGFFNKNISTDEIINHAIQSAKDMAVGSVALAGAGFLSHIIKTPITFKDKTDIWELGDNPDINKSRIDESIAKGEISTAEGEARKKAITNIASLIEKVPIQNDKGKLLTDQQKVEYLYNSVVKNKAKEAVSDLPPKQAEKAEMTGMVAEYKNSILLDNPTDKKLESRKSALEKSLEPKKDAEGKAIEPNEKEVKESKAELEAINDIIENKPKEADTHQSEKIEGIDQATGIPEGDNVPPPTNPEINKSFEGKTDVDIEKRMTEISDGNHPFFSPEQKEFDLLEKEMEKRERDSVFSVPLSEVGSSIDALMKKEKEMPNGYGAFIDKGDARETKEVAKKYSSPNTISDSDLKNDFKESLMGKPATWYADGLRLRESAKLASERGIDIDTLLGEVEKEFIKDGYDVQTAKEVIAGYLKPIFKDSQKVEVSESKLLKNEVKTETTKNTIQAESESPVNAKAGEVEQPAKEGWQKPPVGEGKLLIDENNKNGITHAANAERRNDIGLDEYEKTPEKFAEWDAKADKLIKDGYDTDKLLNELEKGKVANEVENAILKKYISTLDAEIEKNPTSDLLARKTRFAKEIIDPAGTAAGKALVSRKGFSSNEDNLSNFLMEEAASHKVETLPQKEIEDLKKKYDEGQKIKNELESRIKELEKQQSTSNAESVISDVKKYNKKTRKTKEDFISERSQIISNIREKLKNSRNELSATPIPYAKELFIIAPDVAKLVKSLVEEGVTKLADVVDNIHDLLKEKGYKKEDIRDIIAGKYNEPKKTRNEISEQIYNLRLEAKLTDKLDRLERGDIIDKSEIKKMQRSKEVEELKKQINSIERKTGLSNEQKLQSRKTLLKNKIEKLKEDLKSGNYLKDLEPQKPLKLDKEAQHLQDEYIEFLKETNLRRDKNRHETKSKSAKAWDVFLEFAGLRRIVQTAIDLSIPFRQGITLVANPRKWDVALKSFKGMFNSVFSTKNYDRINYGIKESPIYKEMVEDGLNFTEVEGLENRNREEDFRTSFVYKIPVLKEPLLASNRAASAFSNVARYELYLKSKRILELQGITRENDPKSYQEIAKWANNVTGRGNLLSFIENSPKGQKVLGNTFFGARLMASRFNLLNPVYYARMPKAVRMEAIKDMAAFTSTLIVTGLALSAAGGKISLDPDNPEFLQAKFGNTKYDLTGGLVQYIRTFLRLSKAAIMRVNPNVDADKKDKAAKFAGGSSLTFFRNKLAPNTSYALNAFLGKNSIGKEFDPTEILKVYPMYIDDLKQGLKEDGLMSILTIGVPSIMGIGVQNYELKDKGENESHKRRND